MIFCDPGVRRTGYDGMGNSWKGPERIFRRLLTWLRVSVEPTNWARFGGVLAAASVMAFGLLSATAAGALPASIAVSGSLFKVSAEQVKQYGVSQHPGLSGQSDRHEAIIATAERVSMTRMCQSMLVPTPLGDVTMRVTAGRHRPVTATSMVVDAQQLSGDAKFTGLKVGDTSGGVTMRQTVQRLEMDRFRMTARTSSAGTFRMPGMKVSVEFGRHECF